LFLAVSALRSLFAAFRQAVQGHSIVAQELWQQTSPAQTFNKS
jgi:hypothetical protein